MEGVTRSSSTPDRASGAAPGSSSGGRTGRPPVTSRAQILAAARAIIDEHGWEKLTIRRLASELGVGPTTLYHHVRDKDDLLIQLLNDHADATVRTPLPEAPRDRIVQAALVIHDSLSSWPWAAEILTTDGFLGRLGESSLEMVEAIVGAAVDHGCTTEQAVVVFRSIWYFTVGEILVRAHSDPRRPAEPELLQGFLSTANPERFPRLAEIGQDWPVISARDTYPWALEAFVDGLLARARDER
ncbi:TetR/AcrR family transcriptional regulator [Gordonia paraffinivorans]|uniref:TetR/AcrR family transcriptional regulator n=1 Tax=Gordonia paraffinivorans TaxID=175628 RepID=UPI00215A5DE3|nr:TetR/AcrR family transcriptional regulator [Gordonia paraffinivorans]